MKFSIENGFFIPGPSLAAEKQGLGLKFSIENEIFKPRMKISSENESFVRGRMFFSCVRARMNFCRSPGPLGSLCVKSLCAFFARYKPKKVRFANFLGRSPELVPEPPLACKYYTKPLKEGPPELIPDSFPEGSREPHFFKPSSLVCRNHTWIRAQIYACSFVFPGEVFFRENKGGGKLTTKPLPQNGFGPPHQ